MSSIRNPATFILTFLRLSRVHLTINILSPWACIGWWSGCGWWRGYWNLEKGSICHSIRFTAMLLAVYIKIQVRCFLICLNQGQITSPLVSVFQAQYLMTWTLGLGLSFRKIMIANTGTQSPHGTLSKVRGFTGTLRSQMIKQAANG